MGNLWNGSAEVMPGTPFHIFYITTFPDIIAPRIPICRKTLPISCRIRELFLFLPMKKWNTMPLISIKHIKSNTPITMKRFFVFFAALMMGVSMWAQQSVFTVVFATSDDGFVNIRQRPSSKAPILGKLYMFSHGLGQGVLRGQRGNWSKVSVGKVTGWAYSKYVGSQNWYSGNGHPKIVAAHDNTPIYAEDFRDGSHDILFTTIDEGTIIADEYEEDGEFYILMTAHDNLFIKKSDVRVVSGL